VKSFLVIVELLIETHAPWCRPPVPEIQLYDMLRYDENRINNPVPELSRISLPMMLLLVQEDI